MKPIIILAGPSGAGKDRTFDELQKLGQFHRCLSTTTRPSRPGETDGVSYHFVSHAEFMELVQAGAFAEYAEYAGHLYGKQWQDLNSVSEGTQVLFLEKDGIQSLQRLEIPAFVAVIQPTSLDLLTVRLRGRGDSEEVIKARIAKADQELLGLLKVATRVYINGSSTSPVELAKHLCQDFQSWKDFQRKTSASTTI